MLEAKDSVLDSSLDSSGPSRDAPVRVMKIELHMLWSDADKYA